MPYRGINFKERRFARKLRESDNLKSIAEGGDHYHKLLYWTYSVEEIFGNC